MAGNDPNTNFFANSLRNRMSAVPAAGALTQYANGSLGDKADVSYNSRVRSAQINGAGPNADPIRAPWSFTDFAMGIKSLARRPSTPGTTRKSKFT